MAEIRTKQTHLVGTSSLDSCRYIKFYSLSELPDEYNYQNFLNSRVPNSIVEKSEGVFVYDNSSGSGFNVLQYLDSTKSTIGFTTLFDVYGKNISDISKGFYRDYQITNVVISLLVNSDEISIDKHRIRLLSNIDSGKSRSNYPFLKRKDYKNIKNLDQVYTSSILNINDENNITEGIVTESSIYIKNSELYKIKFARNVKIDFKFTKSQVSYIGLDPSLYLWDDEGNFQVVSLTKTLDDIFGTNTGRPFPYTTPKTGISKTDIYKLPELEGEIKTISYFAGKYIITLDGYVFDFLAFKWLKSGNRYLRNIIIDTLDPKLKIWQCSTLLWGSSTEAIREFSPISNSYANIGSILSNRGSLVRKTGDWLVFESETNKIYTNMTKMIITEKKDETYLLNNQCIMVEHENKDYLISDPGFWSITSRNPDSMSYDQEYNIPTDSLDKSMRGLGGFWKYFRKGIMPRTQNTKFLDTFGGIVFYLDSDSKVKYM